MRKVRKAVIPAAGHGTRFLPVTKTLPKEMLALIDRPALQYIAQEAADSGIEEILVVINPEKELIRRYFSLDEATCAAEKELNTLLERVKFSFAVQEHATGTANAVMLARDFTSDEPFAVMYGDDVILGRTPCVAQLAGAYEKTGCTVVGVQKRSAEEAGKYAVIREGEKDGRLTRALGIIEKPSSDDMPSTLCSLGRYILTPDIYPAIEKAPIFRGEKYLTHAIDALCEKGVYAYEFEGDRYDIGDKFGFLQANIELGLKRFGKKMEDYIVELAKRTSGK